MSYSTGLWTNPRGGIGAFYFPRVTSAATAVPMLEGDMLLAPASPLATADIEIADRDIRRDPGLETAILVSLFSDRQASVDDSIPDNSGDRRGWWADETQPDDDKIGSRLWLLDRSKTVAEVLPLAEQYAREALQWMIDDGLATEVGATATRHDHETLLLSVRIVSPESEKQNTFFKYYFNWNAQLFWRA